MKAPTIIALLLCLLAVARGNTIYVMNLCSSAVPVVWRGAYGVQYYSGTIAAHATWSAYFDSNNCASCNIGINAGSTLLAECMSSHPIRSHPIPSYPTPSHPILSHPIPSHPIPSHPIPSHPSHRPAPSHPFLHLPFCLSSFSVCALRHCFVFPCGGRYT
jgi:hypothetical protein